jgi:hypothetical protein
MFNKYRSCYKNKVKLILGSEEVTFTDPRVLYLRHTSGLFRFVISFYGDNNLEICGAVWTVDRPFLMLHSNLMMFRKDVSTVVDIVIDRSALISL